MESLINKKEMGIVFSDFDATLVGGGMIDTWEEYAKECKKAAKFIDLILTNNNYFVIVSSSYHDSVERLGRKFKIIYDFLTDDNKNKIRFFCSETDKKTTQSYEDITIELIDVKEECVDIVLSDLKDAGITITNIVGLGDDEKDLAMLLKIKSYGGSVGVIADPSTSFSTCIRYLDFEKNSIDENIERLVETEFHIEMVRLINKKRAEAVTKSLRMLKHLSESQELQDIKKRKLMRIEELKQGYINGTVTIKHLQKCFSAAELTNRYYNRYIRDKEVNGEVIDEHIQEKIYSVVENISTTSISSNENLLESEFVKSLLLQKN